MTDSLWSWTLAEFRDRTAAGTPMPGGGVAAAVCATVGLGLVIMGLEVTRKGAGEEKVAVLDPLLRSSRELLAGLSAHADRDRAAFNEYLRSRTQEALAEATEAPLAAAADIATAIDLARRTLTLCKPQVRSDVAAGADLLAASLTASLRNVDTNLPGLDDETLRARIAAERAAIESRK